MTSQSLMFSEINPRERENISLFYTVVLLKHSRSVHLTNERVESSTEISEKDKYFRIVYKMFI